LLCRPPRQPRRRLQLSRALADRRLADEVLEQSIENALALIYADGSA
jgi:hypothetical protein